MGENDGNHSSPSPGPGGWLLVLRRAREILLRNFHLVQPFCKPTWHGRGLRPGSAGCACERRNRTRSRNRAAEVSGNAGSVRVGGLPVAATIERSTWGRSARVPLDLRGGYRSRLWSALHSEPGVGWLARSTRKCRSWLGSVGAGSIVRACERCRHHKRPAQVNSSLLVGPLSIECSI